MKIAITIFILLNTLIVSGQIVLNGTLKSYEESEVLPFSNIRIDTIDPFIGFSDNELFKVTTTDFDGNFNLKLDLHKNFNLTFIYVGYVSLIIKNIVPIKNTNSIDLGTVYLPDRGQWIEGYKPPEGETRKETRKKQKKWRKNNEPVPITWAGYSPDFFEPYKDMDTILLEYPPSGVKKLFQVKNEILIIDYKEFIKK